MLATEQDEKHQLLDEHSARFALAFVTPHSGLVTLMVITSMILSCPNLLTCRTPWHDLVLGEFLRIARRGAFHISHDSRRPRAASAPCSPNWCPDATLIHEHESGAHLIVDVACTSIVKRTALPVGC